MSDQLEQGESGQQGRQQQQSGQSGQPDESGSERWASGGARPGADRARTASNWGTRAL